MNLEEQIAQITNHQEFTRLCNAVFTEKYGSDYQVIDGTRSDDGNDGYILSEKKILAMHCPMKPERKTDADYLKKIREDLSKAKKLVESGAYEVENWTFITPRKLSNKVIVELRSLAANLGMNGNHIESTYLGAELGKSRHLVEQFPDLHIPELENKLDEIIRLLKRKNIAEDQSEVEIDENNIYKGEAKNREESDQVYEVRSREVDENTQARLRAIYYKSSDMTVKLNALLGILDIYDPVKDSTEDFVQLCNEGIALAESSRADSVKAHFLAQKGYLVSYIYSKLDMETAFQIMADNAIGFQTITEEYRQGVVSKLKDLEKEFDSSFAEAINLTKDKSDYYTLAGVLVFIGNAAGQRGLYLQKLDMPDRTASERAVCRRALLAAKEIYEAFNDELNVANAVFNLANQIRFFGEEKEALALANHSLEVAKKHENGTLQKKSEWLIHTLETGKIPDYLGGEKRE